MTRNVGKDKDSATYEGDAVTLVGNDSLIFPVYSANGRVAVSAGAGSYNDPSSILSIYATTPKHIPFVTEKAPYLIIHTTSSADCTLMDHNEFIPQDKLLCNVYLDRLKIEGKYNLQFTLELYDKIGAIDNRIQMTVLETRCTEVIFNDRKLMWTGTTGVGSTMASQSFVLKDEKGSKLASYRATTSTSKSLFSKSKKLGEFIVYDSLYNDSLWLPGFVDIAVAMGLVLREQESRKPGGSTGLLNNSLGKLFV